MNAGTQANLSFWTLAEAGITVIRLCEIKPINHADGLIDVLPGLKAGDSYGAMHEQAHV